MEFLDAVADRRSVRGFLPNPVPREVIARLLTVASRAPSWSNVQGWAVTVTAPKVTEKLRLALLSQASGEYNAGGLPQPEIPWLWDFEEPFKSRRRSCAKALYDQMGIDYQDKIGRTNAMLRNFAFFDAPHIAVLSAPRSLGEYGLVDLGCFLQTFLLALVNEGLGGIAQAAVASYAPTLREHLEIPASHRIACGVAFGWADPNAAANRTVTERATVEEFTKWAGFD